MYVVANRVLPESEARQKPPEGEQLSFFDLHYGAAEQAQLEEEEALARERAIQKTVIHIKQKYGKNAIFKGMNLEEGATGNDRNRQIGGHKA